MGRGLPSERLHGRHCVLEALRSGRRPLHRLWLQADLPEPDREEYAAAASAAGVPVGTAPAGELKSMVGGARAPHAVLEAGPLPEVLLEALLEVEGRRPWIVALDGVEDPQNAGAIARVAEAAGAAGLLLSRRHAPPLSPALARASAGAIEWLPVARVGNLPRGLDQLREAGFWIVGADPDSPEGIFDVSDRILSGRLVLVLGAEGRGLRPAVRSRVDHPVQIPMDGRVGSLNVSSAAAVILYEMWRRAHMDGNSRHRS